MNVTSPEPIAQPLPVTAVRPAGTPPVATSPPQQVLPTTVVPASGAPAPAAIAVDPLPALLQTITDIQKTSVPTGELARRYAESGSLTQRAANAVMPMDKPAGPLGAADDKLLSSLSQAYRQPAAAMPLPQAPNVSREIANAQLPNAPATAGNAPAVIVVDGRALPLNPTQTAMVRGALATNATPDAKLLAALFQPTNHDPRSVPLPQSASALRELANAQVAQAANIAREQPTLSTLATARPPLGIANVAAPIPQPNIAGVAPALAQAPAPMPAAPLQQPLPLQPQAVAPQALPVAQNEAATRAILTQLPAPQREQITAQLLATAVSPNAAAIVVDGRTIALNAAQAALLRAQIGTSFRRVGPGTAGMDSEDPTVRAATSLARNGTQGNERITAVETVGRNAAETAERHARPMHSDLPHVGDKPAVERVEAVRAVRSGEPAPYEPQMIVQQPPDQTIIAPGPDRVILAGHQQQDAGEGKQSAIAGIAIAMAPGMTRDDVTAEMHLDGYRITFAGSQDSLLLHASAGLTAQLMFADGTSMRLQLSHD